jgi:hypothetical protein
MRNDMVLSKYPSGEINTARLWYTKSLWTYFNKGKRTFTNEEDFHFFTQSFRCKQTIPEARKETPLKVMSISIVKNKY